MLQALQPGFQAGVVQAGSDLDHKTAEQPLVHLLVDVDVTVAGLDQPGPQLLALHVVQRMGGRDLGRDDAALLGDQGRERPHYLRQGRAGGGYW